MLFQCQFCFGRKVKNNNRKSVLDLDENIITSQLIEIYNKATKNGPRNTNKSQ